MSLALYAFHGFLRYSKSLAELPWHVKILMNFYFLGACSKNSLNSSEFGIYLSPLAKANRTLANTLCHVPDLNKRPHRVCSFEKLQLHRFSCFKIYKRTRCALPAELTWHNREIIYRNIIKDFQWDLNKKMRKDVKQKSCNGSIHQSTHNPLSLYVQLQYSISIKERKWK